MDNSESPKPKLRWYQFSLRTLLVFVLVAGVFFGWLGSGLQRARKNRQAVAELHRVEAEIKSNGGWINYRYAERPPNWLERLLGDPGVFDVQTVRMGRATEADWKHLKDLEGMTHSWELDLSRRSVVAPNDLTDAGLKHLNGLTGLRNLSLAGQWNITDAGLERLKGLASLRVLRLANTQVTAAGVSDLQEALPNARITPTPNQLAALAEIKKAGGVISHGDSAIVVISFARPYHVNVTDAVLVHVEALADLEEQMDLGLDGTQVTDDGLEHLQGLTGLRFLRLSDTKITDAGLMHLAGLHSLSTLILTETRITGTGLVHLKELAELRTLYLRHTEVTDAGLVHLKALTNLSLLILSGTQVTDAGLEHLKGLTNLSMLYLANTRITDAGLEYLKGLTKLERLSFSETRITDAGLEHLKGLTSLQSLGLQHTKVTNAGVKKLQEALPNCKIWH